MVKKSNMIISKWWKSRTQGNVSIPYNDVDIATEVIMEAEVSHWTGKGAKVAASHTYSAYVFKGK